MTRILILALALNLVAPHEGVPDGAAAHGVQPAASWLPQFEPIQPELFAAPGGQANAWADADGDLGRETDRVARLFWSRPRRNERG